MSDTVKYTKEQKKQLRKDRQRIFRIVEYFEFTSIIEGSPVQVQEGYVVSDTETHELFASFNFQNLSEKEIKSFNIRLLLYRDMNIPYVKVPFTYSFENVSFGIRKLPGEVKKRFSRNTPPEYIRSTEFFGSAAYIRLPESYFKKIELELVSVDYVGNRSERLDIVVVNKSKRMSDFDDEKQYAYSKLNIYREAEQYHPTVVVPQKTENAWLCCCGHKNLISYDKCEICGRDKEWEFIAINDTKLEDTVKELKRANDNHFVNKEHFKGYEKELTDEQLQQKIKDYEKVLQNIAEDERRKEHNKKMIIPKILLYYGVAMLLIYLLNLLLDFLRY